METTDDILISESEVYEVLENVKDPEIPVISVLDLGIISKVQILGTETSAQACTITITPTFVGCPAIGVMKKSIEDELKKLGFELVEVLVDYETAWNSNRMSEAG